MSEKSDSSIINEMYKLAYIAEHAVGCENWISALNTSRFSSVQATADLKAIFESHYQLHHEIDPENATDSMTIGGRKSVPMSFRGTYLQIIAPFVIITKNSQPVAQVATTGVLDVIYSNLQLRTPLETPGSSYSKSGPHLHGCIEMHIEGIETDTGTHRFMTPFSSMDVSSDYKPFANN